MPQLLSFQQQCFIQIKLETTVSKLKMLKWKSKACPAHISCAIFVGKKVPFYKNFTYFYWLLCHFTYFPSFLCHFVVQDVPHVFFQTCMKILCHFTCMKISQGPHIFIYNFNAFPIKLRNSFLTRIFWVDLQLHNTPTFRKLLFEN